MSARRLLVLIVMFIPVVLLISACGEPPTQVVPTATATATPVPTATPTPTPTPTPSEDAAIEQVAAAVWEAVKRLDWEEYAELMHPEALQEFKDIVVSALEATGKKDPAAQAGLVSYFSGARDVQSVIALEPKEFLARFFAGVLSQSPQMRELYLGTDFEIIGTVYEGKDLAHVVYRMHFSFEGMEGTKVGVASLKRSGEDWRMLLTGEIAEIAEQLRLAIPDD